MEIIWYGQSMFKVKGKTASLVVDPYDDQLGLKLPKEISADIVLSTHAHHDHNNTKIVSGSPLVVSGPGEYEKAGISIIGIPSYHDDSQGLKRGGNTIFNILIDGINVVHLGDLGHLLTDEQESQIDNADILMVPVGSVYTIDAESASEVVSQLEPLIVIPMHYKLPGLNLELEGVEKFLKEMGAENTQPVPKLTVTKDKLPSETTVVVLSKS